MFLRVVPKNPVFTRHLDRLWILLYLVPIRLMPHIPGCFARLLYRLYTLIAIGSVRSSNNGASGILTYRISWKDLNAPAICSLPACRRQYAIVTPSSIACVAPCALVGRKGCAESPKSAIRPLSEIHRGRGSLYTNFQSTGDIRSQTYFAAWHSTYRKRGSSQQLPYTLDPSLQ